MNFPNLVPLNMSSSSIAKPLEDEDIIKLGDTDISIHYRVEESPKNDCGKLGMRHDCHYTLVSSNGVIIGSEPIMTGSYYQSPNGNTDYINEHNLKVQRGELRSIGHAAPTFIMKRLKKLHADIQAIDGEATKEKVDLLTRYVYEFSAITKTVSKIICSYAENSKKEIKTEEEENKRTSGKEMLAALRRELSSPN